MVEDFRDALNQAPDFQGRLRRLEQAYIAYYRAWGEDNQPPMPAADAPLSHDLNIKIAQHMENCVTQMIDRVEHTLGQIDLLKQIASLEHAETKSAIIQDIHFINGVAAITLGWVDMHSHDTAVSSYLSESFAQEASTRSEQLALEIEDFNRMDVFEVTSNIAPIDRDMRLHALLGTLKDNRQEINFMTGMQADVKMVFAEQIMQALTEGTLSPDSRAFAQLFEMTPAHYMSAAIPGIYQHLNAIQREHEAIELAGHDRYRPLRMQLKPLDLQF